MQSKIQLWDVLKKTKDLGVIEKLSFWKAPTFSFFFLQGFHFFISPSNLLGEVLSQFIFVWFKGMSLNLITVSRTNTKFKKQNYK